MALRNLLHWFYEEVCDYNVFIPDGNKYEDDNDEPRDPMEAIKRQKYATRLYIPLLISKF